MTRTNIISLLIILICIIKSKHTPIIIKNNIKSFLVQTVIALLSIIIIMSSQSNLYENSTTDFIYNIPEFTKSDYYFELFCKLLAMTLYIIFGMLLTKQKSKIRDFLSVFICYIILVIHHLMCSVSIIELYIWVPYVFISPSNYELLQKSTPIIQNTVFFILLLIPTLFMWVGIELKELSIKKFKTF